VSALAIVDVAIIEEATSITLEIRFIKNPRFVKLLNKLVIITVYLIKGQVLLYYFKYYFK
jgi:hypothetical protein